MKWFEVYCGRDWMYRDSWHAVIRLIARRDLMTKPSDEGRLILAAGVIEIGVRRSSQMLVDGHSAPWRPFISWRSDAREITNRLAAA